MSARPNKRNRDASEAAPDETRARKSIRLQEGSESTLVERAGKKGGNRNGSERSIGEGTNGGRQTVQKRLQSLRADGGSGRLSERIRGKETETVEKSASGREAANGTPKEGDVLKGPSPVQKSAQQLKQEKVSEYDYSYDPAPRYDSGTAIVDVTYDLENLQYASSTKPHKFWRLSRFLANGQDDCICYIAVKARPAGVPEGWKRAV